MPEIDGGEAGETGNEPDDRLEGGATLALPDDCHEEGGRDDIAEAEDAVGDGDLGKWQAARKARLASTVTRVERPFADQQNSREEADKRNDARADPALLPSGSGHMEATDEKSGKRYSEADAAEMQRLQVVPSGSGQMAEDDRHRKNKDEGAGDAGREADQQEGGKARREGHGSGKQGVGDQPRQHHRPLAPMRPAEGRSDRAHQIAEIVRRGDRARIRGREPQPLHHAGQDWRIDEAADTHGHRHGDHAGKGVAGGRSRVRFHARDHSRVLLRCNTICIVQKYMNDRTTPGAVADRRARRHPRKGFALAAQPV